jgi:hypothetical protein
MADKSMQLVIGVDIKDVNAAINKTKALESQVKRIVDAHRSGKIDIDNYNRGLSETKKSYDSVSASSRKSSAEIRKLAKQFNEAYDTKSISSVINKTNSLEAEVKKIVAAYRVGKISTDEYNKGLLQTKRAYDSISPSSQKATAEVRKLAKEFNRAYDTQEQVANLKRLEAEQTRAFAAARREATLINQQKIMEAKAAAKAVSDAAKQEVAAFRAARKEAELMNKQFDMERAAAGLTQMKNRSNSTGVAVQQLGYQVGDFMVQVQGGTNAFVAFGQQATQLVGVLPLVATQLGLTTMAAIGISTVLGIAIPLITAVGAAWWRSSQESKKAKEELDELESSLEAIDKTLRDWVLSKKAAEAGVTVEELLGTQGIEKAQKDLDDAKAKLEKVRLLSAVNIPAGEAGAGVAIAGWFAEVTATNNLTEATAEYEKALDRVIELQKKQADERLDLYVDEERNIQQQLALQKVATQKGEKSAEYLRLQAIQRKFNTEQQIKSLDLEDWQKKKLIEINNELIDGQLALELSALAAEQLAEIDIEKGIAQAATRAGQLAKELGLSFETAKKMLALGLGGKKELILDPRDPRYNQAAVTAANLRNEAGTVSPFDPSRQPKEVTTRGSRGAKEDPAIKMLEEISRRKVLIGLTEEQAKRQELLYQTEDKLGEFRNKYGNDFVNNIVNQTMALDEQQKVLDEARAQQEEIGDLISSSMEDAFMSIVDGTKSVKDAFKSMAASIISELYRIFVVKKIVGGITSLFGFADGGVFSGGNIVPSAKGNIFSGGNIVPSAKGNIFSGGNVVPSAKGNIFSGGNVVPFANGGVVSSPMTFPMTGGKTGLMGEAGPEAIMPLKRGKGGKLGVVAENNGNVVINQSFNFSANGDESVKKIIAQAAPQIAQMTKTSIINDRRRGGSTLAAFGR